MLLGCNGVDIHYSIMIIYVCRLYRGCGSAAPTHPRAAGVPGAGGRGWGGGGAELPAGAQPGHRGGGGHRLPAVRAQAEARWLTQLYLYIFIFIFIVSIHYACVVKNCPHGPHAELIEAAFCDCSPENFFVGNTT